VTSRLRLDTIEVMMTCPLLRVVVLGSLLASAACAGPTQVSFVNNERPNAGSGGQGLASNSTAHSDAPPGPELPNDDVVIEPDQPAAGTKQERALVHIHGPNGVVCSGVVLGPRLVATAQRCLRGEVKGLSEIARDREYRVEIASSTLTWTNRRARYAVVPDCRWRELDLAVLVLAEAAPWVEALKIASAPGTGAKVQALGFGHCAGQKEALKERVGTVRNRTSEGVVVDVPLCKGDTGGPVIDGTDGDVIGLISRRDDPEGSPLRTTTIARLDTTNARDLLAQAKQLADGTDIAKLPGVSCKAPAPQ
jgi:hypothetical protein